MLKHPRGLLCIENVNRLDLLGSVHLFQEPIQKSHTENAAGKKNSRASWSSLKSSRFGGRPRFEGVNGTRSKPPATRYADIKLSRCTPTRDNLWIVFRKLGVVNKPKHRPDFDVLAWSACQTFFGFPQSAKNREFTSLPSQQVVAFARPTFPPGSASGFCCFRCRFRPEKKKPGRPRLRPERPGVSENRILDPCPISNFQVQAPFFIFNLLLFSRLPDPVFTPTLLDSRDLGRARCVQLPRGYGR